jgi:DNA-binding CsgD family transcriptional regulator
MTRGGETAIWALGTAAILEGDLGAAAETLTPMAEVFRRAGYLSRGDTRFVVDTIEALALSGEASRARELVAWIDEMPRDNPGGEGTKAQARALLAIADGDLSLADDLLVNAVERFQSVGLVFEQGRALLLSGKVRRRSRSKGPARHTLDEAAAVFSAQGSRGWSDLAESEAERVGAGTRPASGLTDTEEKVALLVAEGLTNKEVAQRMFISTKAVEATLTRLYSKVGIKSRTELVRWALERPEI